MNNKSSITALMSSFGRAFHTENEEHPVFEDHLAKKLMTAEEYAAVQGYILDGVQFFETEICHPRCGHGYLCFSGKRVLGETQGI